MSLARALKILLSVAATAATLGCHDSTAPATLTVSAVSPDVGPVLGGTSVTIIGVNFIDVTSVTIGGIELTGRTVVGTTQIAGTTPVGDAFGPADIIVTSGSHGSGTCSGCFSYVPGVSPQTIAAGIWHTCGLTTRGTAYCWGDNSVGQLGDGSSRGSSTPVAVSGGLSFSSLATNGTPPSAGPPPEFVNDHTCGLTSSGAAYCWGDNSAGQLGNGSTTGSSTPVAVSGGLSFTALATGGVHTCGLTSAGVAYCWGANYAGQLGVGTTTGPQTCAVTVSGLGYFELTCSTVPVAVSGGFSFRDLAAGGIHTCGLTSAGAAYCWGLSVGASNSTVPAPVATGLRWASITARGHYTCGVTLGESAYCWGENSAGQLGTGSTTSSSTPVAISGGLTFSAIAPGGDHTCGLTTSGAAYCWGDNSSGQLGNGSTSSSSVPVAVSGDLSFSALATSRRHHTCGLTTSGAVYCWGDNYSGQLGNGTTTSSSVPVKVAGPP